MALTPEQKSSRLFKKSFGAAETLVARDFFEEPKLGRNAVIPSQIWTEADDIPTTAPTLTDGQVLGVVKYYNELELTHVPGSQGRSFYDSRLEDTIPFNYGDGSYNYGLFEQNDTPIAFGQGDWLLDIDAGVLTFYGTLPGTVSDTVPPKISFYAYVGAKGLQVTGATSGINVKDPVSLATTQELSGTTYDTGVSGFTTLPIDVDGVSSFNEGQRILVKNQTNEIENGIFEVSGTTLVRSTDHDGFPVGEVGVNDYVFVTSGLTLIATSWVLSDTDAANPDEIVVGVDTQAWSLFSQSLAYTADGLGLKLNQQEFYIDLDEGGTYGSGLEQGVDGIRVTQTILGNVSGNTEAVISLDTALSGITEDVSSLDTSISGTDANVSSLDTALSFTDANVSSLDTALSGITENISSLDTALSSETSTRISETGSLDTSISGITENISSLDTALSGETSTRISETGSLSTAIDNFQGLSVDNAGSGLTYIESSGTTGATLNINVDDYTIKIVNDELRTPETWMDFDASTTVSGGTSGETNLTLSFDPVGYVSAYVNGIEYLVSSTPSPSTNQPFFFDTILPSQGSVLWFDPITAGFELESGVDVIQVKYHYINII